MLVITLSLLLVVFLASFLYYRNKTKDVFRIAANIPGPRALPVLGNLLDFGLDASEFYYVLQRLVSTYGDIFKLQCGTRLGVFISNPDYAEAILSNTKQIDKGFGYHFLLPWLGEGMLTSKGEHWRSHRKLLTPAFHFKILEQAISVFNSNGKILLENLSKHVNGSDFEITPHVHLCALDNISETAMGVKLNAQLGSNMDYVNAVRSNGPLVFARLGRPWLHPDFLFWLSPTGRKMKKNISKIHGFIQSIIDAKMEKIQKLSSENCKDNVDESLGIKKRLAFFDLMLRAADEGHTFTAEEIRDEVDSFMFGGQDTVTSAISFILWTLSRHPDAQEKAVAELEEIFGDSDRSATFHDLHNMKYLEMVIKETLRLHPIVPLFARELSEEMKLGDYTVPAGASILVLPHFLMRRADIYPNPEKFDPDRFLPENCIARHPFSFIPFSAGPRNCLGQKFGMLEMKSMVSDVLRRFKIIESDCKEEIRYLMNFVIESMTPLKVKLVDRISSTHFTPKG